MFSVGRLRATLKWACKLGRYVQDRRESALQPRGSEDVDELLCSTEVLDLAGKMDICLSVKTTLSMN